jgi:hypothetical protein
MGNPEGRARLEDVDGRMMLQIVKMWGFIGRGLGSLG